MALHPFIADMMAQARIAGRPALSDGTPEQARSLVASGRAALGQGPVVDGIAKLSLPGRNGTVPARLYTAAGDTPHGLIAYAHGGGWICGTLDDFDAFARTLAVRTGCAVLLIDYRLAPEHAFPCGLHDVEDALLWAEDARKTLFGREVPLVVAGDSAGGNLATVALSGLRSLMQPELQCLFYPVTDSDMERHSYLRHGEGLPLTRRDMRWFLQHYAAQHLWQDPQIAPLRNPDLSGCAPTWIAVAEYDVLHDEGLAFAETLARAGVPVELVQVPALAHGFVRLFNLVPAASQVIDTAAARIRQAVGAAATKNQMQQASGQRGNGA